MPALIGGCMIDLNPESPRSGRRFFESSTRAIRDR
jgi:hypothetical protein